MRKQFLVIGAAVLLGAAACGDGDGKAGAKGDVGAAPGHNGQDVMFAQMMIPHHRQAVEMAKVVVSRSSGAEVKALAGRIEKAQAPEVATMTGWLRQWEAPVPSGSGAIPGMNHATPGMMSAGDMAAFAKLKGAALDRRFLTMMIEHHEGAVTMAKDEQAKGAHGPAKDLAASIVSTQQDEIAETKVLLKR